MTFENLISAISVCENGELNFNNGKSTRAFLYKNKWYPLRATVNLARFIAGLEEVNTNVCFVELAYLFPYVRMSEQNFNGDFPIEIDNVEKLQEVKYLSTLLNNLSDK